MEWSWVNRLWEKKPPPFNDNYRLKTRSQGCEFSSYPKPLLCSNFPRFNITVGYIYIYIITSWKLTRKIYNQPKIGCEKSWHILQLLNKNVHVGSFLITCQVYYYYYYLFNSYLLHINMDLYLDQTTLWNVTA